MDRKPLIPLRDMALSRDRIMRDPSRFTVSECNLQEARMGTNAEKLIPSAFLLQGSHAYEGIFHKGLHETTSTENSNAALRRGRYDVKKGLAHL